MKQLRALDNVELKNGIKLELMDWTNMHHKESTIGVFLLKTLVGYQRWMEHPSDLVFFITCSLAPIANYCSAWM